MAGRASARFQSCQAHGLSVLALTPSRSVIMDVMNVEQAKIAEEAGAAAVMALERIPANIRRDGGVARMVSGSSLLNVLPLRGGSPWCGPGFAR